MVSAVQPVLVAQLDQLAGHQLAEVGMAAGRPHRPAERQRIDLENVAGGPGKALPPRPAPGGRSRRQIARLKSALIVAGQRVEPVGAGEHRS